jgi:hypothetical protein
MPVEKLAFFLFVQNETSMNGGASNAQDVASLFFVPSLMVESIGFLWTVSPIEEKGVTVR